MSFSNQNARWTYAPNGSTTAFVYDNKVLAASDLAVSWVAADGTALALPSWTVTGVGADAGGTVVFATAPAATAGSLIVIERHTAAVQEGAFLDFVQEPAATRQQRFERSMALAQEFNQVVRRLVAYSPLDPDGPVVFPPASVRAGKAFLFDALGRPTVGAPFSPGSLVVAAFVQGLFGANDATAFLNGLGFSAYMQSIKASADAGALLTAEGWSAYMQSLKGTADAAALRAALQVAATWAVGTDIASAATIDLDSTAGGAVVGDERGLTTPGTAIAAINGTQRLVRLVAKADGIKLTHNSGAIASRTTTDIVMRNGDAVTLARTGAGAWRELAFDPSPTWRSANLSVVNGTILAPVPHYLGTRVGPVRLMAAATDTDAGYTGTQFGAGQKLELARGIQQNIGWVAIVSDTTVTVQIASGGLGLVGGTAGNGTGAIDPAKWTIWLEIDPRG